MNTIIDRALITVSSGSIASTAVEPEIIYSQKLMIPLDWMLGFTGVEIIQIIGALYLLPKLPLALLDLYQRILKPSGLWIYEVAKRLPKLVNN